MADREDIDALLVGALYGELDETDRARLDAHLASHPQDRMSLDAMRTTRGLVRDADLAAAMVEPPSAVSALLLQEAARRAPHARTAGSGGGVLGFLASFLRPVMAHPAMSAAAMLVVVAGTAGVLYLRGDDQTVRPARTLPTETATATGAAASPAAPAFENEDQRRVAETGADLAFERDKLAANLDRAAAVEASRGAAGPVDSYRVSLDDGKAPAREAKDTAPVVGFGGEKPALAKGKEQSGERPGYLEVARPDRPVPLAPADEGVATEVALGRGDTVTGDRAASKVAQAQAPALSPPPPGAPATDPGAQGGLALSTTSPAGLSGGTFSLAPPTAAATGGAAGSGAGSGDVSIASAYNARSDAATIAWARDQHARMVKLVVAGNCNDAGKLGAAILRRAPDYYQEHVYNDRRIRACRPYVDKSRRQAEPAPKRDLPRAGVTDEAAADTPAN